jgi:hypothetical protein
MGGQMNEELKKAWNEAKMAWQGIPHLLVKTEKSHDKTQ